MKLKFLKEKPELYFNYIEIENFLKVLLRDYSTWWFAR